MLPSAVSKTRISGSNSLCSSGELMHIYFLGARANTQALLLFQEAASLLLPFIKLKEALAAGSNRCRGCLI